MLSDSGFLVVSILRTKKSFTCLVSRCGGSGVTLGVEYSDLNLTFLFVVAVF